MFKVQDVVKHENGDQGEIMFGPFTPTLSEGPAYLVQWSDGRYEGRCAVIYGQHLKPLPKFKVGQKVSATYAGDHLTVKAGPFPQSGEVFWVVEDGDKDHLVAYEMDMVPVVE